MGALAGLLTSRGHEVRGSDQGVYPPMSDQLQALGIEVFVGYSASNLDWKPDVVVVGNVCSKDHPESSSAAEQGMVLASMPQILGDTFLSETRAMVVSGTHGKTTTSSILAHLLAASDRDPSFFVGGVPLNFGKGWGLGQGKEFVVEGDEYDSAYFDKGSKFLHYRPKVAILTSVEMDHIDIFPSFEAVKNTFRSFVKLIPASGVLIVYAESEEAMAIARDNAQCRIQTYGVDDGTTSVDWGRVTWVAREVEDLPTGRSRFTVYRNGELYGRFESLLMGKYNVANMIAAIGAAHDVGVSAEALRLALGSFAGVRRRQEIRGVAKGVYVIDDYAHHPTAVRETLRALRLRFAKRRIIAVFEPRSASSRRNAFQDDYVNALAHADIAIVAEPYLSSKMKEAERFDAEYVTGTLRERGVNASTFPSTEEIVTYVSQEARAGDVVCVLSSGGFDGIHQKLLTALGDAVVPGEIADYSLIQDLLTELSLVTTDLTVDSMGKFLIVRNENGVAGCVALEVLGETAILRSLAVKQIARGAGYGWLLAETAISVAKHRGVRRLYLLTEDSSDFFAKCGFRMVDLSTIEKRVTQSTAFVSETTASAVAMRLDL